MERHGDDDDDPMQAINSHDKVTGKLMLFDEWFI